ncbi:putative cytoplasmic dynein 1 intermediate chain 2 [Zalerion maritima]|uniref:Cytoplasmic dynein 1 intermediate chain 2 n=1 Tax=Zalerion maritima TaxID=339359 RepID=A0AAD5WW20_9PEZI|nr:putative cytoplasmic dynein 1 intermediate chain 2 [Zalerion maritima]
MQRKEEIAAKRARLAELKRQREQRASSSRQGFAGQVPDLASPVPGRTQSRAELDSLISNLIGDGSRPGSTTTGGAASPGPRGSRPNSVLSAGQISNENSDFDSSAQPGSPKQIPIFNTVPLGTIYETPPSPVKEIFSYSKAVQTNEDWTPPPRMADADTQDSDNSPPGEATPSRRLNQRSGEREEELRERLRKEVEEELRAAKELSQNGVDENTVISMKNFPVRPLSDEETKAMVGSDDFMDFVDKSTKVIERALDERYDILTDYTLQSQDVDDTEDVGGNVGGKGRRRVKEVVQFYDPRWSKNRMITDINFSPKFPELMLASYNGNPAAPHDPPGIVQVWSMQLRERPEYIFHAGSNVLTAKFSAFHPNLIVGGAYTGQVLIWDTRSKSAPVLKTPLTGVGHTHPVYSVDIVGTQNANNVISVSTDGVVCGWAIDMLTNPQELLALTAPAPAKTEDLSPTCMAFPQGDPTYFLVGSEEGTIFACHRYDRAGAKAGVDSRVAYRGHTAPVMSVDFHPARGPVDLGDLVLSSSLDWSARLWKIRAPAATASAAAYIPGGVAGVGSGDALNVAPLIDFTREDLVYDTKWSPVKPGVFALVDGSGALELWDLTVESEEPVARITPTQRADTRSGLLSRSLNKVAWEPSEGRRLATGGIDGQISVFEVGPDLGGKESLKNEEWSSVKKLVARLESRGANGVA